MLTGLSFNLAEFLEAEWTDFRMRTFFACVFLLNVEVLSHQFRREYHFFISLEINLLIFL